MIKAGLKPYANMQGTGKQQLVKLQVRALCRHWVDTGTFAIMTIEHGAVFVCTACAIQPAAKAYV